MGNAPGRQEIQSAVRDKYKRVARSAAGAFNYATGAKGAAALGYSPELIASAPPRLLRSFCGVGNPFALGAVVEGEAVLDVGCGAGFDLYVAARTARAVHGIDLTPEMVARAAKNAPKNVDVVLGASDALPYADGSMDLVISNGVLNLSPRKDRSFREIFRVLKPGGRLQFADITATDDLAQEVVGSREAWSD